MANGKIGVTTENIFPVIKKFLYSDHEIFLRELVANAVDATQKMKAISGMYFPLRSIPLCQRSEQQLPSIAKAKNISLRPLSSKTR